MRSVRIFAFASLAALLSQSAIADWQGPARLRVHVIDVGQGSSTLIETKCGAVLVDAGAGNQQSYDHLLNYLTRFFEQRPDLNKTLESVFLTHCHVDHAKALVDVAKRFTVKRFISNGIIEGSGSRDQYKLLEHIRNNGGQPRPVDILDTQIPPRTGLINSDVDPLSCQDCDPIVRVLSGGLLTNPGWSATEFKNANNKSLVIRFSLGRSSLLITGDMELDGLSRLTRRYRNGRLKSDILIVGHHGAKNGITPDFLRAVQPSLAMISCGTKDAPGFNPQFTAYNFGHPTKKACDLLQSVLVGNRPPIDVLVGLGARRFDPYNVSKALYCTAWDRDIVIDAMPNGQMRVTRGLP